MSRKGFGNLTMARILLRQGKLNDAGKLLNALAKRSPDDEAVQAAVAELGERRDQQAADGEAALTVDLSRRDSAMTCRWKADDDAIQRANLVLGSKGVLTLRIANFRGGSADSPVDHPLKGVEGKLETEIDALAQAVAASIGTLTSDGRFASIAHQVIHRGE